MYLVDGFTKQFSSKLKQVQMIVCQIRSRGRIQTLFFRRSE